jgi:AraC-like DNA-binding protein
MSTPVRVDNLDFRVWRGCPQAMVESHIHSDIEINLLLKGEVEYFSGGQFEIMRAGSLHIFWAGIPHSLTRFRPETEMLWIVIPLAWFLQWELPKPFVDGLLRGRILSLAQPSTLQSEMMRRWSEDFEALKKSGDGAEMQKIVALEVEACLRRISRQWKTFSHRPGRSTDVGGASSSQAGKLAAFIAKNYCEELTIQEIANAVNLHPNYAMQLFRDKCGMSVWEYVLRLRVSHAQYLLLTTNCKLTDVARQSGFASDSRFYAAFEKYSGLAPRAWREKLDAAAR